MSSSHAARPSRGSIAPPPPSARSVLRWRREARIAQQEAERERAEANSGEEQASMHERGLADHELIDESERDRFADVADRST